MALPPNLATNDIISEAWVDAVVDSLTALQVTPWTPVTFSNGWVNEGGTLQVVQYRREGDRVFVRGSSVAPATPTNPPFTLPAGFRPPSLIRIPMVGLGAGAAKVLRGDLSTAGVLIVNDAAAGWTVFNEFSFSTVA